MKIAGVKINAKEKVVTYLFWGGSFYIAWHIFRAFLPEDEQKKLDITDKNNYINRFFVDNIYQPLTGSTQEPGEDIFDLVQNLKKFFIDNPQKNIEDYAQENNIDYETGGLFK